MEPPPTFQPDCPTRDSVWTSLPAAAQVCVREQCSAIAALQRELAGCRAVANEAWAARFDDSADYKVRVLQRAHAHNLAQLRAAWDARRFETALLPKDSLYRLPAELLERVLATRPRGRARPGVSNAALSREVYEEALSVRRVCSQVCQLWEAVMLDNVKGVAVFEDKSITRFCGSPWLPRTVSLAALSSNLRLLVLHNWVSQSAAGYDDGQVERLTAAAAVLRRTTTLESLGIFTTISDFQLPRLLLSGLRACTSLHTVSVGPYAQLPVPGAPLVAESASLDEFFDALSPLPRLTKLRLEPWSVTGGQASLERLAQLPFLAKLYLSFTKTVESAWLSLLDSNLTALTLLGCTEPRPFPIYPEPRVVNRKLRRLDIAVMSQHDVTCLSHALPRLCSLGFLSLRFGAPGVVAPVTSVSALADLLPRVSALTTLELGLGSRSLPDADVLVASLPRCQRLQRLKFTGRLDAPLPTALIAALPACRALASLEFGPLQADALLSTLAPALPRCSGLKELTVVKSLVPLPELRAICAQLPRCGALRRLVLRDVHVGLDDAGAAELRALAERPGVKVHIEVGGPRRR